MHKEISNYLLSHKIFLKEAILFFVKSSRRFFANMLKLNSTGGKLDITISDETIFGTRRKPTVKVKGAMVTRPSHPKGKQLSKSVTGNISEKKPKSRDSKGSNPIKNEPAIKQTKDKAKQERKQKAPVVSKAALSKTEGNKSHDAGIITQSKLENLLSLLNTEGASSGRSLSPEQLSQLITTLGKNKPEEPQDNPEVQVKPKDEKIPSKKEDKKPENETHNKNNQVDVDDKKSQWKRELDEQVLLKKKFKEQEKQKVNDKFEEYNPWGRPGAGAPIRSQSGKVLADYHQRTIKEQNEVSNVENVPQKETILALNMPSFSTNPGVITQSRPNPVVTLAASTSEVKTNPLPVAMRSSFAVGAPGLVAHETQQKRLQELQWKQELEKQIEEKKEREKQRKLKEAQEDLLNLSWNTKHQRPPQPPPQEVSSQYTNDVRIKNEPYENKDSQDTPPQGTQDTFNPLLNSSLNESLKTHARGFGMHSMDPQTKEENDKKRLKMLEHQRAIQEQVEEKRRAKQRERELRLKEEAIEEARLAKEREMLNQAFIIEQKRKREKEEEAKRISEALQQSVLDAYQASQQAKADKRRKHMGAAAHDTRGASTSKSYVVSQATSESRHIVPDNVLGIHHSYTNNRSVLSNRESPRVTDEKTPRTNKSFGRTSQASTVKSYGSHPNYKEKEPLVPPLNLTRGDSPPVPTLRNKMVTKTDPISPGASRRAISPVSTKGNLYRTVSSHSEPCDGSMALSKRDAKDSDVEHIDTQCNEPFSGSKVLSHEEDLGRPFLTLEDAFMIPYHRTDSATLPAPPETPVESNNTQGAKKIKDITGKKCLKNSPPNNGKTITPMYRTASSHLKAEKSVPEVSPRRVKGNKSVQGRHQQVTKPTPSPRGVNKGPRKEVDKKPLRKTSNPQQRSKELERRVTRDHVTPRNDIPSVLSTHREIPEPLPTARQEMILQQLAALRQGLIIKERELKQDAV